MSESNRSTFDVLLPLCVKEGHVCYGKNVTLKVTAFDMDRAVLEVKNILQRLIDLGGVEFIDKVNSQINDLEEFQKFSQGDSGLLQISEPSK